MKKLLSFIMYAALGALLLGVTLSATAQTASPPCLPDGDHGVWQGTFPEVGATRNGVWLRWRCVNLDTDEVRLIRYVGTVEEMHKFGSRLQTIMRAADPLKSLQDAPKRFPVLPLTDPSLAAIVADMEAAK